MLHFMYDKEAELWQSLISKYNLLLQQHILFKKHLLAIINWQELQAKKTGVCSVCKKDCKTHLHHKDTSLRPDSPRSTQLEIWYLPVKDIMYLSPDEIIENTLERFEVEKQIKYFGVNWSEVDELCPACHKKQHAKKR